MDAQNPGMYDGSELSLRSNLDLFSFPKTDVSCTYSTERMPVYPTASTDGDSPLEFTIKTEASYLDLTETYLKIGFRIKKVDGSKCTTSEKACPANLMFGLMFRNMEVYLNNKLISDTNNNYPYVHYIQKMLTLPQAYKNTKLKEEFYYPNAEQDSYADASVGYATRYAAAKVDKQVFLMGQLVCGFFQQERWLPPGNELRIVLRRSHPDFCLDSREEEVTNKKSYRIVIDKAVLYVQRQPVTPSVLKWHRSQLDKNEKIKYFLNEPVVKTCTIPAGVTSFTTEGVITGRVPKVLCAALVSNQAYNGIMSKSPMNFAHNDLTQVTITWNNAENMESRTIALNFKDDSDSTSTVPDDVLEGVLSLQKAVANNMLWNGISKDNYGKGKCNMPYGYIVQTNKMYIYR